MIATPTPSIAPTPKGTEWDSRLFVLRAEDRTHLLARAEALAAYLDRSPDANLPQLAYTLATQVEESAVALAIVANSHSDLRNKLRRACERIGDSNCKQIRDAAGTYFASQPLFPEGKLALLFPGEGAQYPNMLADLCGVFPEVEETFDWCDRLASEVGKPEESLRKVLHLPVEASPRDRAAAEAQMRRLGPSIFGVLIADLAIQRVLQNFQLPVAAVAGHSAGELAALLASGALPADAILGPKLAELMDLMQKQEDETGGPEVSLLAVGAGKAVLSEIAEAVAGRAVVVAMDNCPHQCVAVGPTHLVARVEAELLERGLVCERLPFRRPYHTPLFEPWMAPYRQLFDSIPFELPHTPTYCCSTGSTFPDNRHAIRSLAVNHWVSPVEFSKMIDAMYADGIRIFVEAGPRGNLSAFAEDILRGKPFAAIPANLPRKSGPAQINHLIAQLVVHNVPVALEALFRDCEEEVVDWQRSTPSAGSEPNTERRPIDRTETSSATQVMDSYLDAMEKFLEVQRSIMEGYLRRVGTAEAVLDLGDFALPGFEFDTSNEASLPVEELPQFALIDAIEQLDPGQSIVVRRTLDEREDLFADHHTLAGRSVSKVDPAQNGLPVLPMTFSIEAMAEAASLLVPGKVVVEIRNIRLYRWLPFDPDPTTLEIRAWTIAADPDAGTVEVKADVRDLGNSFVQDGANKIAAEAVLVLADRYPNSPEPAPFELSEKRYCRMTVEDLRRNMFHGPIFQMIEELGCLGKEGIEGKLVVKSRSGWFRSNSEPRILLDPVLIDASMHLLGAWHLEQPDWTGRILLPFEVQRMEFFGPVPDVGSSLIVRGRNEQESARHFRHGLELFGDDNRLWMRISGAGYWRFYLPFGSVNFFGPKDEYFLSIHWPEAVARADGVSQSCLYLDPPADLKQPVLRAAGARATMTPREQAEFRTWSGTDEELNAWFFGRLVAKDAVRAAWMQKYREAVFPADIETESAANGLVCRPRSGSGPEPFPPVSVAIAGGRAAAFSAFAERTGIALLNCSEGDSHDEARVRAAILAVADALRCSNDGLKSLSVDRATGVVRIQIAKDESEKASELAERVVRVQTASHKDFIVATTICEVEHL